MKTKSVETISKIKMIIALVAIGIALLGIFSCSHDNDAQPDAQIEFLKKLTGTWTLNAGTVTKDDIDVTDAFPGMEITFTNDKMFTVKNPVSPLWPAAGSFTLQQHNSSFDLVRFDDVVISIEDLRDHNLKLSFIYESDEARSEGVTGEFTFNLTR